MNLMRNLACLLLLTCSAAHADSICYGTTSKGKIEGAVQLPREGANFSSYSDAGVTLGRTYVHAKVAEVVSMAYRELAKSHPDVRFVYGETGWKSGGSFKPHRTHQNGLSVDFFVPVRDASGRSVPLPTSVANKFGYDIEFDAKGKFGEYTIDFEAIAEHLHQLDLAAKKLNAPIVNNRGQTTIKSSVKKNGGLSPNIPNGNNVSGYTSLWKWDSLPFGDTLPNSNPSGLGVLNFNHRFPGQYYDKETGLYQNWNRDYDPSLGRYVQSDPWGLRAHPNTYTYVGAVPTIAIDPHGTDLVVIVGGQRQGSPNIFGHISVGVCGSGIYSFGTLTPYGSSISAFIVSQSTGNNPQNTIRDQTAYVIRTNVIQDALALASLREAANRSLGILADNCANRTQAALVAAGIPAPHSGTPGSVENSMRALVSAGSANSFSIPAGTTSLPAGICQN